MQAGSLLVSVFGDVIHPRGGVVWLGCLIKMLEPLALNERLIRTAIFRLVKEDWLETQTQGRRTDYGLSEAGQLRIEEASKLIYGGSTAPWDEQWRIVLTNPNDAPTSRTKIRKALQWQGFGEWNATTFLHPSADLNQVIFSLDAEGLTPTSPWMTLKSELMATTATISNQEVVEKAWDLQRLSRGYLDFLHQYKPARGFVKRLVNEEDAFLLRVLLVHDFRRLLLRDPMLPESLLPAEWPGLKARQVFNEMYVALQEASERHLDHCLKLADDSTPRRGSIFKQRMAAIQAAASADQMS